MKEDTGSVSPKGQVTLPAHMRQRLGIRPKDRVVFRLEGEEIKVKLIGSRLEQSFQAIPPLRQSVTLQQMTDIAHEEHAQQAAKEGL